MGHLHEPAIIAAIVTVLAGVAGSVATILFQNRKRLNELVAWAWGSDRDPADKGVSGHTRSLDSRLGSLEDKIDESIDSRQEGLKEIQVGMKRNRLYFRAGLKNLTDALNRHNGFEITLDDVEPDWADDDDFDFPRKSGD